MFDFSLFEDQEIEAAKNAYDNLGAYKQLQLMMNNQDRLNVKFYTSAQDQTPCAWIESKNVAGFRYILKNDSLKGLIDYLMTGEARDFDSDPMDFEALPEEETDFQGLILRQIIESSRTIQWVPLFREYRPVITGFASFKKGKIQFRLERSKDNLSYLREYRQAI